MNRLALPEIQHRIFFIRGHKVMLDSDLALLYGVRTFNLNKAVARNRERFPGDFMFRLTHEENQFLIFQIGISRTAHGGRRHMPYVFTEQGVSMLSSVVRSKRAIQVNVAIMRAFVRLRQWLGAHEDLAKKLEHLEMKYDSQFKGVFDAIRELRDKPVDDLAKVKGFRYE